MKTVRWICIVVVTSAAFAADSVEAKESGPQVSAEPVELAEAKYVEGREAYVAGRFDTAATLFERAFELSGDRNLLFNIAAAHESAGNLEAALVYYRRFSASATQEERAEVNGIIETLERRTPATQPAPPTPSAARLERQADTEPSGHKIFGPAAIALTSVTAASAAVAIGLGAGALARARSAARGCRAVEGGNVCSDDSARDDAARQRLALGADITLGIAAASAVAVIAIVATNVRRRSRSTKARSPHSRWTVAPRIGLDEASVGLGARF